MSLPHRNQSFHSISLSGLALVGNLEREVDAAFATFERDPDNLVVDLSEATFVEIPTLQCIIALAASRMQKGLSTQMRVPGGDDGADARDYLRRIEFAKAVHQATGIRFQNFVVSDDLRYFTGLGGDQHEAKYSQSRRQRALSRRGTTDSTSGEGLERELFFPFTTWPLGAYLEKGRAADEALDAWSVQTILAVLDKYLKPPEAHSQTEAERRTRDHSAGIYVGSRIVFEAMTNAIRHPGASVVQVSSVLRKGKSQADEISRQVPRHFTATFWDNGASVYSTLRTALEKELSVRFKYPPAFDTDYRLRYDDLANGIAAEPIIVNSSQTPTISFTDDRLMLSAFYPGVTCDVTGKGHRVPKVFQDAEPALATQGMGLFALVRTVVNRFDGSLSVRSGDYFMNIKGANLKRSGASYDVKIVRKPKSTPPFLGNLLTIRLPLRTHDE